MGNSLCEWAGIWIYSHFSPFGVIGWNVNVVSCVSHTHPQHLHLTQREFSTLNYCVYPQLLCLIGEAFDEQSDDICGAVVNIRNKGDKLGIWTRDFNRQDSILKIG